MTADKKARWLARIALGSGAAVFVAACGGPSGSTTSGPDLNVGVVLPSSGVYATLGEDITNGMRLYLDKVGNTAGNRKVVLHLEDEANDPATALAKTHKLVEQENVDLLTGFVSTPDIYGARDYLDQNQVVTLVSNAGGNALSRAKKSKYIYRTSFSAWQVSQPLGKYVAENVGKSVLTTVADYGFGTESAAAFKESFATAGGTDAAAPVKAPLGTLDYGTYITKIEAAKPAALYAFYAGTDAVNFLKQGGQAGLFKSSKLTGAGFLVEQDILTVVASASPDGAISSLFWALTLDNPANKSFVSDYQKRYNKLPDVYAVQGYDTARVIVDALNATGGNTKDKDKLLAAIAAVNFSSPRGTFKFDSATQNPVQDIYIRQVYNDSKYGWTNKVISTIPAVVDPGK